MMLSRRDERKLERIAREAGGSVANRPNELARIKRKAKRRPRPKINPRGRTILMQDNEIVWTRKKEVT